jgi:hypothetical protein
MAAAPENSPATLPSPPTIRTKNARHERLHRHERRNHDAAEPGKAGAGDESPGRKPAHGNTLRLCELGIAHHRADAAAGAALPVPDYERCDDRERNGDQQQTIDRIFGAEELDRSGQRNVHAVIAEPENRFGDLAQQQAQAPGRHQRVERAAVERTDHDPLDRETEDRAHRQRQGQRGKIGPAAGLRHVGAIGADHDEFAMRDIEHAEQAEDHSEPECQNRQPGDAVENVDRLSDDQRIHLRRLLAAECRGRVSH